MAAAMRMGHGRACGAVGAPGRSTVGALTAQGCQRGAIHRRNDTIDYPWMINHRLAAALNVRAIRSNHV